jgi:hypothetical protein
VYIFDIGWNKCLVLIDWKWYQCEGGKWQNPANGSSPDSRYQCEGGKWQNPANGSSPDSRNYNQTIKLIFPRIRMNRDLK